MHPDTRPKNTFCCPICAATAFERLWVNRPNGSKRQTEMYYCPGCSVVFADPDMFGTRRHGEPPLALEK